MTEGGNFSSVYSGFLLSMVSSVSAPNMMVNRLTTFVMATRPTFWLKPMVVTTQAETMGLTKRRQYFAVRPRSPSMQPPTITAPIIRPKGMALPTGTLPSSL